MRIPVVVLGIALAVVGVVVAAIFSGHHLLPYAGDGLVVFGAMVAFGGVMMRGPSAAWAEFKCGSCGKTFASDTALKAHTKDKHGT